MAVQIILTFSSPDEKNQHPILWNYIPSKHGERWLAEMTRSLQDPKTSREQRFLGWANRTEDQEIRVRRLNDSIATINDFFSPLYEIKERAYVGMSQDHLNVLHHHFEIFMGQSWDRNPLSVYSPRHVLRALLWLNDLVHDYEQGDRAAKILAAGEVPIRSIHCQLHPLRQYHLLRDELKDFSYAREYGDLAHAYVQLGKTWIDALNDEDVHIFPENITPARLFGASFCIYFDSIDQEYSDQLTKEVKTFIQARARAANQDIDPDDPKHALGQITYARLPKDSFLLKMSELDRAEFIRTHSNILSVKIKSGATEIERTFEPYTYENRKLNSARIVDQPPTAP